MLLEIDGIDSEVNWLRNWGLHNSVDDVLENVPYALLRLQSPASVRAYDTSRMRSECYTRYPDQDENHSEVAAGINDRDILFVRNISQDLFRRKLVEHFDILFERRALQWPRLERKQRPNIERI